MVGAAEVCSELSSVVTLVVVVVSVTFCVSELSVSDSVFESVSDTELVSALLDGSAELL